MSDTTRILSADRTDDCTKLSVEALHWLDTQMLEPEYTPSDEWAALTKGDTDG